MSYWAATVITNLLSAIPFIGTKLVVWVWGGYAVSVPTLTRFYTLHFLLPFLVIFLVGLHIFFLHASGRSNPLGVNSSRFIISFHYYYSWKDILGMVFYFFMLLVVTCLYGYNLIDAENFILANSLVTPTHIQPEWYFLFAYAILRSIPNKLGGVVALVSSILVLFFFPLKTNYLSSGFSLSPTTRLFFWTFITIFILLTWLGIMPAEYPFTIVRAWLTFFYFLTVIVLLIV